MGSPPNDDGASLTVTRARTASDEAEIIDLVQLPKGTRPTPIAYVDFDEVSRCRVLDCALYAECLAFAASVHWKSFHCRQCPRHPARSAPEQTVAARASGTTTRSHGAAVIKLR